MVTRMRTASEARENDRDTSTLSAGNYQRVTISRSVLPAKLCALPQIPVMGKRKTLEKEKTDLEKENSQLKLSQVKLNRQAQSLSKQMQKARAEGNQPSCGHSHAKSPSRCTACHQRNLKRKRLDGCSESLLRLEAEGYTATNVKVRNDKTGESTCQADR